MPVAEVDITDALNGQTFGSTTLVTGSNLFRGPLSEDVPDPESTNVFVVSMGGPAPDPYFGGPTGYDYFRESLWVWIRSPAHDMAEGRTVARAVLRFLHKRQISGYTMVLALNSSPESKGFDNSRRHLTLLLFSAQYKE